MLLKQVTKLLGINYEKFKNLKKRENLWCFCYEKNEENMVTDKHDLKRKNCLIYLYPYIYNEVISVCLSDHNSNLSWPALKS